MSRQLQTLPPPDDWLPTSPEDPLLVNAYERALATLSLDDQERVARGEIRLLPGDRYKEAVKRDLSFMTLYNHKSVPPRHLHVVLAHLCREAMREGGFAHVFTLVVGNLLPECRDGFAALGMKQTAHVLQKAMDCLGEPYPRTDGPRTRALQALPEADARLGELTGEFLKHVDQEAGGFEAAADAYVSSADFPAVDDVSPAARARARA
jgi:hypothetical protein